MNEPRRAVRIGFPGLILIAAVIFALAFVTAPWFAFRAIRSAAENQDAQALAGLVDYGAVRAGLRSQIQPVPVAVPPPPPPLWSDPIGAVKRALQDAPLQIQAAPQVETYLTAGAMAQMTRGQPPVSPAATTEKAPFPKIIYWDIGRCRIAVAQPGAAARRTVFTFERRGLLEWKLVQIRLPTPAKAG